jgi:curved DNA-binding protein CbpA
MVSHRRSPKTEIDWDIRLFRRYPMEIPFTLKLQDRIFEAKTVDYCPAGVGIVISDPNAPLNKGDLIGLEINELNLHEQAKAAWVYEIPSRRLAGFDEMSSGLRVGMLRIEHLKGRFNIYPLSDLLIGLQRTSRTGILKVNSLSLEQRLFLKKGDIVFAESNYEKDRLSDVLLKSHKINERQYNKTEEIHGKTGSPYAAILVHMGYVKSQDVKHAIELQVKRMITRLFLMKDAEFEFIEGASSPEKGIALKLSIADLIYRAVKKNADVELLESYLLDSIVYFSSNPLNLFRKIRFTELDRTVISYVDGKRSIGDIIKLQASAGGANPLKTIFALLEARFLKITEKRASSAETVGGKGFEKQGEQCGELSDEIKLLYSSYRNLDYYHILGVTYKSSQEEIKKAYYSAAKKYHPDKHLLQLREEAISQLTEIFTYITNAYLTLTNHKRRKEYDSHLLNKDAGSLMTGAQEDVQPREHGVGLQSNQAETSWNPRRGEQYFTRGKTAFWHEDFGSAAREFASAIYFDPTVSNYHYYYGRTLLSLGNPKKAVEALNRAKELEPLNADILAELGHVYLTLNFPLRARSYFSKAVDLVPSNKRAMEGIQMLGKKKH